MLKPVKWNLWDYIVDATCKRTDCWEDKYIIVWDWMHWIPMPFSAIWWYTAWDWIKISDDWVISIDPDSIDLSNYYTKAEIDEMLEWLDPSTIQTIQEKIVELETKLQEIEDSNPEEVKFARITMDGDTETEFSNEFITADTDAILTWTSGEPNWIIETYVENWKLIIKSSENESGTVRVRLSKPKDWAFLN